MVFLSSDIDKNIKGFRNNFRVDDSGDIDDRCLSMNFSIIS